MLSVDEALEVLLGVARPTAGVEQAPTESLLGRVLAGDVVAPIDVPGHDNSAMDGYAIRALDAAAAAPCRLRVAQRIAAGQVGAPLAPGEAARIFTGAPLPEGADAVVIQEDCRVDGDHVEFDGPVAPGAFVRPRGNDIGAGAALLEDGTRIRPQEMGLLASVGLASATVRRPLRVAFFSTGDELVQPGADLGPGAIYNSNRFTLAGLLAGLRCCEPSYLGIVPDSRDATVEVLERAAASADVLLTTGGVSVGEEDHLRDAIERVGRLEMWRVAVKPGKPLAYGRIGDLDVIGLPGNPVSTLVTFCLFVRPFLLRRLRTRDVHSRWWPVRADFEWPTPGTRREFVRARLEPDFELGRRPGGRLDGAGPAVRLFPRQGSDVLTSTSWADGLVEIPEGERIAPGDIVRYAAFSELLC